MSSGDNSYSVVVGDYSDDKFGQNAGAAFVYEFECSSDTNCYVISKRELIADRSNSDVWERFGGSVAMASCDGNAFAIVGAQGKDRAYMFEYNTTNNNWTNTVTWKSDNEEQTWLGKSVAMDCDKELQRVITVIGSPLEHFGDYNVGNTYIYQYDYSTGARDSQWVKVLKLVPADYNYADDFGTSVGIYGNITVVSKTMDEYSGAVYFVDLFNIELPFAIDINYNYLTKLEIIGTDNDNSNYNISFVFNECELESNFLAISNGVQFESGMLNGCFEITFSDCDDSVTNDRTDYHGYYDIKINGTVSAYGGYYRSSESNKVCTNKPDQFEFCITPRFCQNMANLTFYDRSDDNTDAQLTSYRSVTSSFIAGNDAVECSGDHSCNDNYFEVSTI